jgi:hypothetical protein
MRAKLEIHKHMFQCQHCHKQMPPPSSSACIWNMRELGLDIDLQGPLLGLTLYVSGVYYCNQIKLI